MATLCHLINQQATKRSQQRYLLDAEVDCSMDYLALQTNCLSVNQTIKSMGLRPGDTVSLAMPNGLNTVRLLLACMWGGLCVNPVNLLSQPEQMAYVLDHSDCKLVITTPEWADRVKKLLSHLSRTIKVLVATPDACKIPSELSLPPEVAADAISDAEKTVAPNTRALLMYTSGTTGVPKGVLLTHAQLLHNALAIVNEHQLTDKDRVLAVLPLYHINAFVVTMLAPLASGGSLALVSKFSVGKFWSQVAKNQCTWINLVPTMVSYLLEAPAPDSSVTAPLRFCRSASASLPPEHLRGFERKFGIGLIETMGLTETAAPSFSNPLLAAQRKLGSVGRASGCGARVVDADFNPVPDGVTGEVVIRGGNVMMGYYKNPDATAATLTPDQWLRTGDLGHRDQDGFFFITGRIKELIIKGGENIAPREIDEVLLRHPDVLDAAAVGCPDKHYGQEILACVLVRPGCTPSEDDLKAFCEATLGRFKTPKFLHFVDALPRGPSGKVQRLKLPEFIKSRSKSH